MCLSCIRPSLESLESRRLFAAEPTAVEQYVLQLINQARVNPAAEAAALGISLNEGLADGTISASPKQPLAFNLSLITAAEGHSSWMLSSGVFSHTGPNNNTQFDRDSAAGYSFVAPARWGENIALTSYPGDAYQAAYRMYRNLFIDAGYSGRGHRVNLLDVNFREIGIGEVFGQYNDPAGAYSAWVMTQDMASTAGAAYLTGTVFSDANANGKYDSNEGFGGVTIEARDAGGNVYRTSTWSAGGYSMQVPAGTYHVTAYGGGMPRVFDYGSVTIGSENVLVNFNSSAIPVAPTVSGGTLQISGTPADDSIRVLDLGANIRVLLGGYAWDYARNGVNMISVDAGAGNDLVDVAASLPRASILGGGGNDTLWGTDQADTIYGGDGDDVIYGRKGNDYLSGDKGRDSIMGGAGDDTLLGGQGRDTVIGGDGNDSMGGGKMDDYLDGKAGDDTLVGGEGSDTLIGGDGNETIYAADRAPDTIDGGSGTNVAYVDPLLDSYSNVRVLM